jgi:hypothetical protein
MKQKDRDCASLGEGVWVKVRRWSEQDIENARKVLTGIKPGRKPEEKQEQNGAPFGCNRTTPLFHIAEERSLEQRIFHDISHTLRSRRLSQVRGYRRKHNILPIGRHAN